MRLKGCFPLESKAFCELTVLSIKTSKNNDEKSASQLLNCFGPPHPTPLLWKKPKLKLHFYLGKLPNYLRTIFTHTLMHTFTCQWTLCAITVVPGRIMAVWFDGGATEILAIVGLTEVDTLPVCNNWHGYPASGSSKNFTFCFKGEDTAFPPLSGTAWGKIYLVQMFIIKENFQQQKL